MEKTVTRDYWPTDHWRTVSPQDVGIDHTLLTQMQTYIQQSLPGLHSLLIVRHGYLAFEAYYQNFHQNSYHSLNSATKGIVSALVGVALTQNILKSLDQRMLDFFPEYAQQEKDPRKQAITLHHLLSLQTGFSKDFPHEYWRNPVQLALQRPMESMPGEQYYYDSQGVDIAAGILTLVTGMNAAAFADKTLFGPLGIWRNARFIWEKEPQGMHTWHPHAFWDEKEGYLWKIDPQGNSTGGFGAHLTAREMAKLGYLYLNRGWWDGTQVIATDYITESTRKYSEGGPPVGVPCGYLWYVMQDDKHTAFFASGAGGQLIYVVPALDLVVVTAATLGSQMKDPLQWKYIRDLVPRFILPAIIDGDNVSG